MAKVFLTCFAPFKAFSSDELAVGLFSSLVVDLQRLQMSLEESPLSLQWCCEAVSVIKKTHSHFLLEFERSEVLASWEAIDMVDEYMSATLELLDLCNLLKSAISSLDRYRMMVDFVFDRLNGATFSTMSGKIELERLEGENFNKFFDVKKLRDMNLSKEGLSKVKMKTRTNNNIHALQAIRSTMSIISLFIFFSVLHPIPVKIDKEFYARLYDFNSSHDTIRKLISTFCKRFQDAQGLQMSVLIEKKMIEDVFEEFKGKVVSSGEISIDGGKLAESLENMKKISMALKEGIDMFEGVVNELFENVIEGRKRVINYINLQ